MSLPRILGALLIIIFARPAEALNPFECLRDLMPITDRASLRRQRNGVERPFLVNGDRFLVFPEAKAGRVTGFYLYDRRGAWYYDAIESKSGKKRIAELDVDREKIYELTAQPGGIETVTVFFLPGFDGQKKNKQGPMVLGASVLPVVGAFVSRPNMSTAGYQDPSKAIQSELDRWSRKRESNLERTLVRLSTIQSLTQKQITKPLQDEVRLRREWIKGHNLDNQSFRALMRVMDRSCRE